MPTPATEERFTVEIGWNESIEAYVARVPDIPELAAWDETQEDALRKVRKAIRANIEIAKEYGDPVPEPSTTSRRERREGSNPSPAALEKY